MIIGRTVLYVDFGKERGFWEYVKCTKESELAKLPAWARARD
jgi:hypothetical protein